jgi:hypothetical protein
MGSYLRVLAERENGKLRWVSRIVHESERAAQKELANSSSRSSTGRSVQVTP